MKIKEELTTSPNPDYTTSHHQDSSRTPSPSGMEEDLEHGYPAALPAKVAHGTSRLQTDDYEPNAARTCEWVIAQYPYMGLKPGDQQLCQQTFYNIGIYKYGYFLSTAEFMETGRIGCLVASV